MHPILLFKALSLHKSSPLILPIIPEVSKLVLLQSAPDYGSKKGIDKWRGGKPKR